MEKIKSSFKLSSRKHEKILRALYRAGRRKAILEHGNHAKDTSSSSVSSSDEEGLKSGSNVSKSGAHTSNTGTVTGVGAAGAAAGAGAAYGHHQHDKHEAERSTATGTGPGAAAGAAGAAYGHQRTDLGNFQSSKGHVVSLPPRVSRQPLEQSYGGDFTNSKNPTEVGTGQTHVVDNAQPHYDNNAEAVKGSGKFFDPQDTQGGLYGKSASGHTGHSGQTGGDSHGKAALGAGAGAGALGAAALAGGVGRGKSGEHSDATQAQVAQNKNLKTQPSAYYEQDEIERQAYVQGQKQAEHDRKHSSNTGSSKAGGPGYVTSDKSSSGRNPTEAHSQNKSAYNEGGLDSAIGDTRGNHSKTAAGAGGAAGAAAVGAGIAHHNSQPSGTNKSVDGDQVHAGHAPSSKEFDYDSEMKRLDKNIDSTQRELDSYGQPGAGATAGTTGTTGAIGTTGTTSAPSGSATGALAGKTLDPAASSPNEKSNRGILGAAAAALGFGSAGAYAAHRADGKEDTTASKGPSEAASVASLYNQPGVTSGKSTAGTHGVESDAYNAGVQKGAYDSGASKGAYDSGASKGAYDSGATKGAYDSGVTTGAFDSGHNKGISTDPTSTHSYSTGPSSTHHASTHPTTDTSGHNPGLLAGAAGAVGAVGAAGAAALGFGGKDKDATKEHPEGCGAATSATSSHPNATSKSRDTTGIPSSGYDDTTTGSHKGTVATPASATGAGVGAGDLELSESQHKTDPRSSKTGHSDLKDASTNEHHTSYTKEAAAVAAGAGAAGTAAAYGASGNKSVHPDKLTTNTYGVGEIGGANGLTGEDSTAKPHGGSNTGSSGSGFNSKDKLTAGTDSHHSHKKETAAAGAGLGAGATAAGTSGSKSIHPDKLSTDTRGVGDVGGPNGLTGEDNSAKTYGGSHSGSGFSKDKLTAGTDSHSSHKKEAAAAGAGLGAAGAGVAHHSDKSSKDSSNFASGSSVPPASGTTSTGATTQSNTGYSGTDPTTHGTAYPDTNESGVLGSTKATIAAAGAAAAGAFGYEGYNQYYKGDKDRETDASAKHSSTASAVGTGTVGDDPALKDPAVSKATEGTDAPLSGQAAKAGKTSNSGIPETAAVGGAGALAHDKDTSDATSSTSSTPSKKGGFLSRFGFGGADKDSDISTRSTTDSTDKPISDSVGKSAVAEPTTGTRSATDSTPTDHHNSTALNAATGGIIGGVLGSAAAAVGLSGQPKTQNTDSLVEKAAGYDDVNDATPHKSTKSTFDTDTTNKKSDIAGVQEISNLNSHKLDSNESKNKSSTTTDHSYHNLEADVVDHNKKHGHNDGRSLIEIAEDNDPSIEKLSHHKGVKNALELTADEPTQTGGDEVQPLPQGFYEKPQNEFIKTGGKRGNLSDPPVADESSPRHRTPH